MEDEEEVDGRCDGGSGGNLRVIKKLVDAER